MSQQHGDFIAPLRVGLYAAGGALALGAVLAGIGAAAGVSVAALLHAAPWALMAATLFAVWEYGRQALVVRALRELPGGGRWLLLPWMVGGPVRMSLRTLRGTELPSATYTHPDRVVRVEGAFLRPTSTSSPAPAPVCLLDVRGLRSSRRFEVWSLRELWLRRRQEVPVAVGVTPRPGGGWYIGRVDRHDGVWTTACDDLLELHTIVREEWGADVADLLHEQLGGASHLEAGASEDGRGT